MSTYVRENTILKPVPHDLPGRVKSSLPLGTYSVGVTPEGFYLQAQDDFKLPPKIYGSTPHRADRILATFNSRPRSTGVMLSGEKGSGKTLMATLLSTEARAQGISTLVVNSPLCGEGFNAFIQSIDEPCVVIFDEFEKVYYEQEWQSALLTLFDGTAVTKKLFIVTTNDSHRISDYMRNRPGRMYYSLKYETLEEAFILEYCEDLLKDKTQIDAVLAVTSLYDRFNLDMLKALVEEMNRYGETPRESLAMLNVRPDFGTYHVFTASYFLKGAPFDPARTDMEEVTGHPLQRDDDYDVSFYSIPRKDRFRSTQADWEGPKYEQIANVEFGPEHLVRADGRKGEYEYKCGDAVLVLTKKDKVKSLYDTYRDAY
jgi:hypothetical protein